MTGATHGARRSANVGGEEGISLVEVLIAILLLSIVMMALASTAMASLASVSRSEARQQAYTEATLVMERIRNLDFTALALHADGLNGPLDAEPFQQVGPIAIRTVVGYPDPDNRRQVRVTVVAEFERRGDTEIVRQSTLVNSGMRVEWGLEQPKFSPTPVFGTHSMQRTPAHPSPGGPSDPECVDRIEHRITNQGARDSYQLIPPTSAQVPGLGAYDLRIYEVPTFGLPKSRVAGQYTDEYDPGESFRFRICYGANDTATSLSEAPFTIHSKLAQTLHSGNAPMLVQLSQQVFHSIDIETEHTGYLAGISGADRDPTVPYVLSSSPSPNPMPNHDTAADDLPGLALPNVSDDPLAQTAVWRQEFHERRRITAPLELEMWTSSPLAAAAPGGATIGSETATIVIEVRKLASDGTLLETVFASSEDLTHNVGGWTERSWNLTLVPTVWSPGEQLELALRCSTSSSAPCLLGFGGQDYPASLRMEFP